jgi:hypothetical protein
MTPFEHLCLSSFARGGYAVRVFTYDPDLVIPAGTERVDAREVLPEAAVFENLRERGTYAAFSNIFRYRLLQLEDTTWVDTDVMLVGDSLPAGPYLFGYEDPGYVNSAILRAPTDSPFLHYLYDMATAVDPAELEWGQIGPRLVTEAVTQLELHHLVQPIDVLYPVHYREVGILFDPLRREEVDRRLARASTLHLWNEIMRRGGAVKEHRPPRDSWLAAAFETYGIDFSSDSEHDVEWVHGALSLKKGVAATGANDGAVATADASAD